MFRFKSSKYTDVRREHKNSLHSIPVSYVIEYYEAYQSVYILLLKNKSKFEKQNDKKWENWNYKQAFQQVKLEKERQVDIYNYLVVILFILIVYDRSMLKFNTRWQ